MRFFRGPAPPFPGVLDRGSTITVESSPGAWGVFGGDSSQRVFTISGYATGAEGSEKRRRPSTFVLRSLALINLALKEDFGTTIEWEKWREEAVVIDRSPYHSVVRVEGSRVFVLREQRSPDDEICLTVYDFSPGARKRQGDPSYASQRHTLPIAPPFWDIHTRKEVSGDAVVFLIVRDLTFARNC